MRLHLQQRVALRGITAAAFAVAIAAVPGTSAQAALYTGAGIDDEYSTAANWDDNAVPASGSTQDINGAFTVERSVDSVAGRTFISGGATVNVTGGTHNDNQSGSGTRNFLGRGSTGTINQSGGDHLIGHLLSIGGGGANGNGAYYLTNGSLTIYRGSNSIIDGANPQGRPSLEVSDEEAAGSGLFEISGGSLATRGGVGVGTTGVFSVVGSNATSIGIGSDQSLSGAWLQQAGGTLKAAIDAGGITSIFLDEVDAAPVLAEFLSGSVLDLGFDGIAPIAGTWTLLEAENADITDGGLGLSGATASGWSFDVDNSGANGLLTATYAIPEPTSMALLVFGSLFLGRRRSA